MKRFHRYVTTTVGKGFKYALWREGDFDEIVRHVEDAKIPHALDSADCKSGDVFPSYRQIVLLRRRGRHELRLKHREGICRVWPGANKEFVIFSSDPAAEYSDVFLCAYRDQGELEKFLEDVKQSSRRRVAGKPERIRRLSRVSLDSTESAPDISTLPPSDRQLESP